MVFSNVVRTATYASYGVTISTISFDTSIVNRIQVAGLPLGIASRHWEPDEEVYIGNYWQPRIDHLVGVPGQESSATKKFQRTPIFDVDFYGWDGETTRKKSYRLFPPKPAAMYHPDAKRLQAITAGPEDSLYVSRNADGRVFELRPSASNTGRWNLVSRYDLTNLLIHALYFDLESSTLFTIESRRDEMDKGEWRVVRYSRKKEGPFGDRKEIFAVPFQTYGITRRPEDDAFWFTADIRSQRTHGIYRGDICMFELPDIGANGLCFLSDGSAIATFYGESSVGITSALGSPSEIIYMPAALFD